MGRLSLRCRINANQIKLPGYTQTQLPSSEGEGCRLAERHIAMPRPRLMFARFPRWRRIAAQRRAKLTPFRLPCFKFAIRSIHVLERAGILAGRRSKEKRKPVGEKSAELITPLDTYRDKKEREREGGERKSDAN